jgi:radical SAM protein with 4Fe4S-binding SPASM domain
MDIALERGALVRMLGKLGFRLGNQVVLVRGKHASALYDLHRGRVQKIANGLADLMTDAAGNDGTLPPEERAIVEQSLARLASRKFVESDRGNGAAPVEAFTADWTHPQLPLVRTVSMEVDAATTPETLASMRRLVLDASARAGLCSFAFVGGSGSMARVLGLAEDLLAGVEFSLCEFWSDAPEVLAAVDSSGLRSRYPGRVIVADASPGDSSSGITESGTRATQRGGDGIGPGHFICRADYYHLLRNFSESHGCLHVDNQGDVYPDVSEQDYCIGALSRLGDLESLLGNARLLTYWNFGKDQRGKCSDCEFRYVCPNPLSMRADAGDLASAPGNCSYDLEAGAWAAA